MCTVLLPPGVNPIVVKQYIIGCFETSASNYFSTLLESQKNTDLILLLHVVAIKF